MFVIAFVYRLTTNEAASFMLNIRLIVFQAMHYGAVLFMQVSLSEEAFFSHILRDFLGSNLQKMNNNAFTV